MDERSTEAEMERAREFVRSVVVGTFGQRANEAEIDRVAQAVLRTTWDYHLRTRALTASAAKAP